MSKLYKRASGVYYVRFKSRGLVSWRSLRTTDRREAEQLRRALDRTIAKEPFHFHITGNANPSLSELSSWYEHWALSKRSKDTIEQTSYAFYLFGQLANVTHVRRVTSFHLDEFQRACLAQKYAPRTINKMLTMLSAAVHHAQKRSAFSGPNPFAQFEKLRVTKKLPLWLSPEQTAAVMKAARAHSQDAHLFFALGIFAGLRKDEILESQWSWVDLPNSLLTVRTTETFQIKDCQERPIDVRPPLREILARYQPKKNSFILKPELPSRADVYRFDPRKLIKAVTSAAGVPWCSPKRLRYTFASSLVTQGIDLFYVQRQLGHSDPKTTLVYAHLAPRNRHLSDPQQASPLPKV